MTSPDRTAHRGRVVGRPLPERDLRVYRAVAVTLLAGALVGIGGTVITRNSLWCFIVGCAWIATGLGIAVLLRRGER